MQQLRQGDERQQMTPEQREAAIEEIVHRIELEYGLGGHELEVVRGELQAFRDEPQVYLQDSQSRQRDMIGDLEELDRQIQDPVLLQLAEQKLEDLRDLREDYRDEVRTLNRELGKYDKIMWEIEYEIERGNRETEVVREDTGRFVSEVLGPWVTVAGVLTERRRGRRNRRSPDMDRNAETLIDEYLRL